MYKAIYLLLVLGFSIFVSVAKAQVGKTYDEGQVTAVTYLKIKYGRFDDYVKWLQSTWKPTMEAEQKAGLIVSYKVFTARPESPNEPNLILMITYKNMAGLDKAAEEEVVTEKVIGSAEVQNRARQERGEYREVLGSELIRELILKPAASPDQPIAVLPFENLSEEKANADFAEGIRREIIARLTTQHVKAASVQEAPQTGELLVGSVQHVGNRVRVSVQLVDATSRVPRWTQMYDRELTDVLEVESEIAENVAKFAAAQKP